MTVPGASPLTNAADGAILVVNAGSSSIKLALFETGETRPFLTGLVERIGSERATASLATHSGATSVADLCADAGRTHETALAAILPQLQEVSCRPIRGVGHRIVHGGPHLSEPALIDEGVLAALERLVPLARTHQPHGLAGIGSVRALWPSVPQVACFDTAFHATI
ncbi:MAG: acetate kinase, partial [Pseudomonadota bacterium]